MRLKRFTGPSVREAVEAVRRELGDDAVIVQTRRLRATGWRRVLRRCDEVLVVAAVEEGSGAGRLAGALSGGGRWAEIRGLAGLVGVAGAAGAAGSGGSVGSAALAEPRGSVSSGGAVETGGAMEPGGLLNAGRPAGPTGLGRPVGPSGYVGPAAGGGPADAVGRTGPDGADEPWVGSHRQPNGSQPDRAGWNEPASPLQPASRFEAALAAAWARGSEPEGAGTRPPAEAHPVGTGSPERPAAGEPRSTGVGPRWARPAPGAPDTVRRRLLDLPATLGAPQPLAVQAGRQLAVVLVGPTGGGKTTTLAKLAAHLRFEQGWRVGLVAADAFRAGALQQLEAYARLLGLDCRVAASPRALERALARLADCDVVLVDSSGRGHRDAERLDELRHFVASARAAAEATEVHLVLPATLRPVEAEAAARAFRAAGAERLILTKLDECELRPAGLEVASVAGLPCSYATAGQRVPEDLVAAWPDRLAAWVEGEPLRRQAPPGVGWGSVADPEPPVQPLGRGVRLDDGTAPAAPDGTGRQPSPLVWGVAAEGGVRPVSRPAEAGARPRTRTRGGYAHVEGSSAAL